MLPHLRRLPLALRRRGNASSSSSNSENGSKDGGKDGGGEFPFGRVSRSSLDSAVNMDAHTHLDIHQVYIFLWRLGSWIAVTTSVELCFCWNMYLTPCT